jgi:hypothetical protein
MEITVRQLWMVMHLGLGALYLHGFGSGLLGLVRSGRFSRLTAQGTTLMAISAWATVLTGTYVVYPWYRAVGPTGADITAFPRSYLLANPALMNWHNFGMEWKEHIGWLAPILATAVAYVAVQYRGQLEAQRNVERMLSVLLVMAFVAGIVSAGLGAILNKVAPNAFLGQ